MSDNSLWGDLSRLVPARTPSLVLQEQANLLQNATNEILVGRAKRLITGDGSYVHAFLEIVAPALRDYSIEILRLTYDASTLYPVSVISRLLDKSEAAVSEEELRDLLREFLTSHEIRTIISSLIAESQLSGRK